MASHGVSTSNERNATPHLVEEGRIFRHHLTGTSGGVHGILPITPEMRVPDAR